MTQRIDFEPITNREDWIDQFEVRDVSNALVDLSAASINLSVRDKTSKRVHLHAEVGSGITVDGLGLFTVSFLVGQMRSLDASLTYEVGCVIKRGNSTQQYFTGVIPVMDGIVE